MREEVRELFREAIAMAMDSGKDVRLEVKAQERIPEGTRFTEEAKRKWREKRSRKK